LTESEIITSTKNNQLLIRHLSNVTESNPLEREEVLTGKMKKQIARKADQIAAVL